MASRSRRKCEIQETGLFVANPIRSAKREFVVRAFFEEPLSGILITLSFSSTFQRVNKRFFSYTLQRPEKDAAGAFWPLLWAGVATLIS